MLVGAGIAGDGIVGIAGIVGAGVGTILGFTVASVMAGTIIGVGTVGMHQDITVTTIMVETDIATDLRLIIHEEVAVLIMEEVQTEVR